jgi:ribonuclease T2
MRRAALVLAAVFACVATPALARHSGFSKDSNKTSSDPSRHRGGASDDVPGAYDYYLMALSWSPTYCETHADDDEQCAHRGYGFVLHGLWPQYNNGGGPQRCASDAEVDRKTVDATLAFMPSRRLINHEWGAHGTCSGMTPAEYFATADRAFAAVQAPSELKAPKRDLTMTSDQLRGAFRRANPGLADNMMNLHCSKGELVEVRVCLDKNLSPRACGKRMRNACPAQATFTIPASQ